MKASEKLESKPPGLQKLTMHRWLYLQAQLIDLEQIVSPFGAELDLISGKLWSAALWGNWRHFIT